MFFPYQSGPQMSVSSVVWPNFLYFVLKIAKFTNYLHQLCEISKLIYLLNFAVIKYYLNYFEILIGGLINIIHLSSPADFNGINNYKF